MSDSEISDDIAAKSYKTFKTVKTHKSRKPKNKKVLPGKSPEKGRQSFKSKSSKSKVNMPS